jgi:hypothetical protein
MRLIAFALKKDELCSILKALACNGGQDICPTANISGRDKCRTANITPVWSKTGQTNIELHKPKIVE